MVTYCSNRTCGGHLGRYRTCKEEAIDVIVNDGEYEEIADNSVHGGSAALVYVEEPCTVDLESDDPKDGRHVRVPDGWYVVVEDSDGRVWVDECDDESEARGLFSTRCRDIGIVAPS